MTARLIICEKSGHWAAALRRAAGRHELPIGEVRSPEQAQRELAQRPASILAIEVSAASVAKTASQVAAWRIRYPAAQFLLLADPDLNSLEPELREAGACHVVYSTRDLAATVRLIRRHLARAPRPHLSLEESIWAALPWPSASA
ncbi:MAG TPA: hypothetical protein VMP01_17545 [Pirellulaceae bacterium]|nr:hypothetical protein [Pirellulaceae bacterium]